MHATDGYQGFLSSLPASDQYELGDLLVPGLLMAEEGQLRMFYSPFDWVNESARLIILGITPGWTQMELACRTARAALSAGKTMAEACQIAKQRASFAGSMRTNLIRMLDTLGLPSLLQIDSSADLFGRASHLLHTGSALRYPIFVGSKNYTGSNPAPSKSQLLLRMAREVLAPELAAVPHAAIVPLGRSVEEILGVLGAEGRVGRDRWLSGFPHPSGANGHRARLFEKNRLSLARQLQDILGAGHVA